MAEVAGLRLEPASGGTILGLRVSPGAARARLLGVYGDRLKVAVREPPERGKANRGVRRLLASALDLPPRDVEITTGETSPDKTVLLRGVDAPDLRDRLARALLSSGA